MDAADRWLEQQLENTPHSNHKEKRRGKKRNKKKSIASVKPARKLLVPKGNDRLRSVLEGYAFQMRLNPTPAEAYFLKHIAHRLQKEHGVSYETQKVFFVNHDKGFILDFWFPIWKLAVELDGSGHFTPEGKQQDQERTKLLGRCGVRVFRFTNCQIMKDSSWIYPDLLERFEKHSPVSRRKMRIASERSNTSDDEAWAGFNYAIDKEQ